MFAKRKYEPAARPPLSDSTTVRLTHSQISAAATGTFFNVKGHHTFGNFDNELNL